MNYKKIIKNRSLRLRILRMFSFIPDKPMLKIQYRIKMGRKLDLKNPKRFTEKLQWYKLYYKDPLLVTCADKADVREYVRSKGLESILVPCYGIFDRAEDIPWEELPDKFVMKDTLGGGGTSVIIVPDKEKADLVELTESAKIWVKKQRQKNSGREWPYYSGKSHRIIIEKLIQCKNDPGLNDYKFFCFNGKCAFLYVMGERDLGKSVKVSIFDRDFRKMPVSRVGDEPYDDAVKPQNYDELLRCAETLAADFPHVRVDLYDVDGAIYFGELTFYGASGYMEFDPDSFDIKIGKLFELPDKGNSCG